MDSLTHIALGAAIGEAVLGRRLGAKAAGWGAVAGSLPDIDVPMGLLLSELGQLALHRAWTHSLLFVVVAGVLLGLLAARVHRASGVPPGAWVATLVAAGLSHVLLDAMTSYGTQLFLPFSDRIVSIASISIIDPLYTLPLAVGVVVALRMRRYSRGRRLANGLGLGLSSAYLGLALVNSHQMTLAFERALATEDVDPGRLFVKPTLFNNVLWRGIAEVEGGYLVGFRSLFDPVEEVAFVHYPANHAYIAGLQGEPAIRILRHVSEDWFQIVERGGRLHFNDLRFGTGWEWAGDTETMAFSYRLIPAAESGSGRMEVEHLQLRVERGRDGERLRALWARMMGRTSAY
jgi:inner membrane protein